MLNAECHIKTHTQRGREREKKICTIFWVEMANGSMRNRWYVYKFSTFVIPHKCHEKWFYRINLHANGSDDVRCSVGVNADNLWIFISWWCVTKLFRHENLNRFFLAKILWIIPVSRKTDAFLFLGNSLYLFGRCLAICCCRDGQISNHDSSLPNRLKEGSQIVREAELWPVACEQLMWVSPSS